MSAIWGSFGVEWELDEKVSFNGVTRTITVHDGVTDLEIAKDVYSAWVRWVPRGMQYLQAMRVSGYDPIPGGFTGATYFLANGWKLIYDPSLTAVKGVLYSDDFDTAFWSANGAPIYPTIVSALVNTVLVGAGGGSGDAPTVSQIRQEMDINSIKLQQIKALLDSMTIPTPVQIRQEIDNNSTKLATIMNKQDDALTKTEFLALN